MKLIVGLGNPGGKYHDTPHNLGFTVVESMAQEAVVSWSKFSPHSELARLTDQVTLLKPQTFVNESGQSVREIMDYFKIELADLWVVHDDLDLPPGEVRLSFDSSSAGHKGVQSIIDALGSQAFGRCRLGIGRPPEKMAPEDYVLAKIDQAMKVKLNKGKQVARELIKQALTHGFNSVRQK